MKEATNGSSGLFLRKTKTLVDLHMSWRSTESLQRTWPRIIEAVVRERCVPTVLSRRLDELSFIQAT